MNVVTATPLLWVNDPIMYALDGRTLWFAAAWFAVAAAVLGAFDISLPRGDALGVTGALDIVALLVLGPVHALVVTASGALVSFGLGVRALRPNRFRHAIVSRLLALAVAAVAARAVAVAPSTPARVWLACAIGTVTYLLVELLTLQTLSALSGARSVVRAIRGNLTRQGPLLTAQFSVAVLACIVYPTMGVWSLILVVAVLLLIRQSYAVLLEIRETFRTTIEVLVDAAESSTSSNPGHAERTAQIARDIAFRLGLSPSDVERVSYAALLHDIGQIDPSAQDGGSSRRSAKVIEGVAFFSDVLGVVRLCDAEEEVHPAPTESELTQAFVVALSSDIDALECGYQIGPQGWHGAQVAARMPLPIKAKVVGAAINLGYRIPAL